MGPLHLVQSSVAPGISLANKSLLLFGFAVVVILSVALAVPWARMQGLVEDWQRESMRQLYQAWLSDQIKLGIVDESGQVPPPYGSMFETDPVRMNLASVDAVESMVIENQFVRRAMRHFDEFPDRLEYFERSEYEGEDVWHYARAVRASELRRITDRRLVEFTPEAVDPAVADPIRAVFLIDRRSEFASSQSMVTTIFIVAAWLFGSLLAILVFYFILTKLIFSPVRRLREIAEKVEAGDTTIRANIRTGDEFEQLSSAFNSMLERFSQSQKQLRSMNETLDLRLTELAEANLALYESNRLKGEFLASVSHELKTPLNLIVGFSELLEEIVQGESNPDPKRIRYIMNIRTSAKSLQEMISDLLEMARIEAGRVDLSIEKTNVEDLISGLQRLLQADADRRGIQLRTSFGQNLPAVETDAGRLQQILYNFLSNALKFTPQGGTVTIGAERVARPGSSPAVRMGVKDTGEGVPTDMHEVIFEKFRQVDASHTRKHQGVGLGLAICRELSGLLGGRVWVESNPGCGATFFVEIPVSFETPKPQPLMAAASDAR